LEFFISQHKKEGLSDELSADDWRELQDIATILESFNRITLELEGYHRNGALYDIFPAFDMLLEHIENAKGFYVGSTPHLLQSLDLAWEKLNKYYALTEFNPVLYAAVVLHPSTSIRLSLNIRTGSRLQQRV